MWHGSVSGRKKLTVHYYLASYLFLFKNEDVTHAREHISTKFEVLLQPTILDLLDRHTEDVRYPCLTQINGNWSNSSRKCVTEWAYIQNTSLLKFVGFNKDCDADQKR